jgi:hypothetical protein
VAQYQWFVRRGYVAQLQSVQLPQVALNPVHIFAIYGNLPQSIVSETIKSEVMGDFKNIGCYLLRHVFVSCYCPANNYLGGNCCSFTMTIQQQPNHRSELGQEFLIILGIGIVEIFLTRSLSQINYLNRPRFAGVLAGKNNF